MTEPLIVFNPKFWIQYIQYNNLPIMNGFVEMTFKVGRKGLCTAIIYNDMYDTS